MSMQATPNALIIPYLRGTLSISAEVNDGFSVFCRLFSFFYFEITFQLCHPQCDTSGRGGLNRPDQYQPLSLNSERSAKIVHSYGIKSSRFAENWVVMNISC